MTKDAKKSLELLPGLLLKKTDHKGQGWLLYSLRI